VKMQVTVPPNTTAEVSVPSDDAAGVLVDSQSLDEAIEGVRIIGSEQGAVVLEVGSGAYRFTGRVP